MYVYACHLIYMFCYSIMYSILNNEWKKFQFLTGPWLIVGYLKDNIFFFILTKFLIHIPFHKRSGIYNLTQTYLSLLKGNCYQIVSEEKYIYCLR